ncbi:MAG TPA: hypothetical protein VD866_24970 [Urbifossiella sp.]|nr:hypothetical protein [Urbifossiella sp.]
MAKGSPIVLVRFSPELRALVRAELARRNRHSAGAEWTVSDWVRAACTEKALKGARSRRTRPGRTRRP